MAIIANSFTKIDQLDGFSQLERSVLENSARSRNQSDRRICSIPPAHELEKKKKKKKKIGLLTKCEVQDGWIVAKFFFCVSRSINSQKRTKPISNHLDRTNLVNKGFIILLSGNFFLQDTAGSPERARWLHLARSGSQSQRAIWFILPARGACHLIITVLNLFQRCSGLKMNLKKTKAMWIGANKGSSA